MEISLPQSEDKQLDIYDYGFNKYLHKSLPEGLNFDDIFRNLVSKTVKEGIIIGTSFKTSKDTSKKRIYIDSNILKSFADNKTDTAPGVILDSEQLWLCDDSVDPSIKRIGLHNISGIGAIIVNDDNENAVERYFFTDSSFYPSSTGGDTTLGTASKPWSDVYITNQPTEDSHATRKDYVDAIEHRGGYSIFGSGIDGNVTITSDTNLTRDMYYNNLTINDGKTLNPNGYRIFVQGTLTILGTGKIAANGGDGGDGTNGQNGLVSSQANGGTGGSGGTGTNSGYLPGSVAGQDGGDGGKGSGEGNGHGKPGGVGLAGTDVGPRGLGSNGVAGTEGGYGGRSGITGSSGGPGGPGGSAGTRTNSSIVQKPNAVPHAISMFDIDSTPALQPYQASAGSGGSGGGGGGAGVISDQYGGGGGGGAGGAGGNGGFVCLYANDIAILSGSGMITADGGNGGKGGNGGNGNPGGNCAGGGGGAGGSGGNGGVVVVVYNDCDTDITARVQAYGGSGGAGGIRGTNYGTATGGQNGCNGNDGKVGATFIIRN